MTLPIWSEVSASRKEGMISEKPLAGPPLLMIAFQSRSGSRVVALQSVKSGNVDGSSKPRVASGAPLPSVPWHAAHAARKMSRPLFSSATLVCPKAIPAISSARPIAVAQGFPLSALPIDQVSTYQNIGCDYLILVRPLSLQRNCERERHESGADAIHPQNRRNQGGWERKAGATKAARGCRPWTIGNRPTGALALNSGGCKH